MAILVIFWSIKGDRMDNLGLIELQNRFVCQSYCKLRAKQIWPKWPSIGKK